jgi:hypothetical protein
MGRNQMDSASLFAADAAAEAEAALSEAPIGSAHGDVTQFSRTTFADREYRRVPAGQSGGGQFSSTGTTGSSGGKKSKKEKKSALAKLRKVRRRARIASAALGLGATVATAAILGRRRR